MPVAEGGAPFYAGVDPGKKGAIVFLTAGGVIAHALDVPTVGKEYDIHGMLALLKAPIAHLVLEGVGPVPMGGKASNFDFGRGKGIWEGLIAGLGIPCTQVAPAAWQKEMWQGIKRQFKAGTHRSDPKKNSFLAAGSLAPGYSFERKSKGVNDGLVDAYLMAEYCRRHFKK